MFTNMITLSEDDLIEGMSRYLKTCGYKKKNKRWTKDIGEFTLTFFIQGSVFDKDDYYIRPGVFINDMITQNAEYYGHFFTGLKQQSVEQVIQDYEQFIKEWTDKPLIKARLLKFNRWERWLKLIIPTPPEGCDIFFSVSANVKKYILKNF